MKAKLNAAVIGVQDALFMKYILKSLGLKVKLPTRAKFGNGESVDIGNNLSIGSRTCHVEMKKNFLQELKEAGIIEFQWISTASNEADMFTKKQVGPKHNKHAVRLYGHDKYYSNMQGKENHEQGKVAEVVEHS